MKYYFAPMEGITGYVYRVIHRECFLGIDKYFTPFLTPSQKKAMTPRENKDVLPEHNKDVPLVPQILTNCAADFIKTAKNLQEYGYEEVNLIWDALLEQWFLRKKVLDFWNFQRN